MKRPPASSPATSVPGDGPDGVEHSDLVVPIDLSSFPCCSRCTTIGYREESYCPRCGSMFRVAEPARGQVGRCPRCYRPHAHPVEFFCTICGEEQGRHVE